MAIFIAILCRPAAGKAREYIVCSCKGYSSRRIINNLLPVVIVTLCSGAKPSLSSHTPLRCMTGTVVRLHRLTLILGWIFKLLVAGRVAAVFFSEVYMIRTMLKCLAVLRTSTVLSTAGLAPALCQAGDKYFLFKTRKHTHCENKLGNKVYAGVFTHN